jgi:26S proteasome regulatory subunit N9
MLSIIDKVNTPASKDAYVYALIETASLKLLQGEVDQVQKDLEQANSILDNFDSVNSAIHAAFYRVNADYYSVSIPLPSFHT